MRYQTIRVTARDGGFPNEAVLRGMVKRGECPGVYQGTRFYVDTVLLRQLLDEKAAPKNREGE